MLIQGGREGAGGGGGGGGGTFQGRKLFNERDYRLEKRFDQGNNSREETMKGGY